MPKQEFAFIPVSPEQPGTVPLSPQSPEIPGTIISPETYSVVDPSSAVAKNRSEAVALYTQNAQPAEPKPVPSTSTLSDVGKYKDDQLLKNPGGDRYDLDRKQAHPEPVDHGSFLSRVGKDLSDAWGNVKNAFKSLLFGRTVLCRGPNDEIREVKQRGLLGSIKDFFCNMGSALTFGALRPEGEPAPNGILGHLGYAWKKAKQAIFGDLIEGVSGSINRMGKSMLLAGWNLMEVVPDATIGNFEAGQKLTTTLFDNGQVLVEYVTDVIPTGEAWMRVHAAKWKDLKPPVIYNISTPEHKTDDARWETVRNTPFRKTIETLGALLADVATFGLLGQTIMSFHDPNQKKTF
ncbi:MAG: hypothetical protein AB9873_11335 [Syntrophobacteraceae bacterium]